MKKNFEVLFVSSNLLESIVNAANLRMSDFSYPQGATRRLNYTMTLELAAGGDVSLFNAEATNMAIQKKLNEFREKYSKVERACIPKSLVK